MSDWRAGDVVRLCGGTVAACGPNNVENRWIILSEPDENGDLEFLEDWQVDEDGPVLIARDGQPAGPPAETDKEEP